MSYQQFSFSVLEDLSCIPALSAGSSDGLALSPLWQEAGGNQVGVLHRCPVMDILPFCSLKYQDPMLSSLGEIILHLEQVGIPSSSLVL